MNPIKVLCFELFGDYAQFRKFFTNMSPLSFSIPPRTALAGIVGAVLGIDKQVNPEQFTLDNSFFAIRLINPVKKTKIAHNYLKTGSITNVYNVGEHKPTNVEFLKDVRYRVYFAHEDQRLYGELKSLLESHQTTYTISLGISGCLANYNYIGEFELMPCKSGEALKLDSVVPMASVQDLIMNEPVKLQKVVLPSAMNNQREVLRYDEVLYEMNGMSINLILKTTAYQVGELQDTIHGI
mgnify:CR=1 FL=1